MSRESRMVQSGKSERDLWFREQGLFSAEMFAEKLGVMGVEQVKRYLRHGAERYPVEWREMGVYAWKNGDRQWCIKVGQPPVLPRANTVEGLLAMKVNRQLWLLEWRPKPGTSAFNSILMVITNKLWRKFPGPGGPLSRRDLSQLMMYALDKNTAEGALACRVEPSDRSAASTSSEEMGSMVQAALEAWGNSDDSPSRRQDGRPPRT